MEERVSRDRVAAGKETARLSPRPGLGRSVTSPKQGSKRVRPSLGRPCAAAVQCGVEGG